MRKRAKAKKIRPELFEQLGGLVNTMISINIAKKLWLVHRFSVMVLTNIGHLFRRRRGCYAARYL